MKKRQLRSFADEVCRPVHIQGDRHGILVLHGFSGTIAQMRPLIDRLAEQGFTVRGINLPGHAQTMQAMARSTWQDWLDAAKNAFMELQQQCDQVSVVGLSMGGCLALILAEQMRPTAIATVSAPMGSKAPLWLCGVAWPIIPTIYWKARKEGSLIDDRFDYSYPGFPTHRGLHLQKLISLARRDLYCVQCPALIVQSRMDDTVAATSADVILKGIASTRKGVMWLEDAPHVCTLTPDVERIAQEIGKHFRQAEDACKKAASV